jgi:hypothetical protein
MRHALAMLALLLGATPALAQVPTGVQQGARQAQAECRSAGGRPNLLPAFQTTHDFNGDGQPDYVHDYSALDCQGAASFFCGSAGCPVVVFLSPGFRAQALGHAQGWTVEAGGPLPVMVLTLHGSSCGRVGANSCEQRVGWNGRALAALGAGGRPAAPAVPQTAPQTAPQIAMPTPPPVAPPTAAAPAAPGGGTKGGAAPMASAPPGTWEVRTGADGRAIAVAAGPGVVRAVAVLCHEGVPVVALALRARPPAGPVTFGLAGRGGRAQVPITPGGGDVWYGDLRNSALPRLFTGSDSTVEVLVNGGMQGRLSLQGSTRAVREALAPCLRV